MMAFDHVFLDVAKRESLAIQAFEKSGKPGTYLFREFYCTDPGCDCRRVVLIVEWIEERRVAASINYAFEPSRRRDEPQLSLDPLNPQSERAEALLALWSGMIAKDAEYRERLIRHYAMWRQVVDDPAHPEHAKVRGAAHADPDFRPAFPARKPRTKVRRAAAPAAGSQSLERVAAKGAQADSKLQQRFQRLLRKVDRLKQQVHTWKDARPAIATELSLYAAARERLDRSGRDMLGLLDRAHAGPGLTKPERKKLAALICSLAGDLIELGGHDDLKPLYNRHSRSDFDTEVASADAEGAEALRSMMERLGYDFGDADVDSMDKLRAFAEEQQRELEQEAAAEAERRAKRKKSAKQLAAEARREEERRNTGKALQEVYRALAMALHPDREQDPAERARKTDVMREVNVAYEAKDLLRLLELQLEIERIDPARADAIAEERMQRYNRILDEQAKQLASELDDLQLPFLIELELAPTAQLTPSEVIAAIRADTETVTQQIAELARDLESFEDVTRLKVWLKTRMRPRGRAYESPGREMFG